MFIDRKDAGEQLAEALKDYKGLSNGVVVAVPRGGVVPGRIVAEALGLPMEITMVKKIGHPSNPEYAIGAVSLKSRVLNQSVAADPSYIESETERLRKMMLERYKKYCGDRPQPSFSGKVVIVVDDGVATGYTLNAALDMIRQENPVELIVAVPVGPPDSMKKMKKHADKIICLRKPKDFYAISVYYETFGQVSDGDVRAILREMEAKVG